MKWENLSFAYGDHFILRDLTLELPTRGVTGLMGASGVGKSTLLRVLTGLEKKAAGQITDPPESVSILFQDDRLFPHLTVLENLTLILKDRAMAEDWLKKVRLDDAADRMPAELSGGMRRRAALARALAYPSDLLLLDEPLGGLDAALCEKMGDLIRVEGTKRAVLVSLHSEADAERICDRILLLQDGQLTEKKTKSPE